MIEPVDLQDFLVAFFSAAAVILFGAGYAGLFAWALIAGRPRLMPWAYACYSTLAVSVMTLADAAHLNGSWTTVAVVMVLGYLLAPHLIWHLCSATHPTEHHVTTLRPGDPRRKSSDSFTATRNTP